MRIQGFVQITPEEAFFADVHIVKDIGFSSGEIVGYMELENGQYVNVKKHPAGTYNGQIVDLEHLLNGDYCKFRGKTLQKIYNGQLVKIEEI